MKMYLNPRSSGSIVYMVSYYPERSKYQHNQDAGLKQLFGFGQVLLLCGLGPLGSLLSNSTYQLRI